MRSHQSEAEAAGGRPPPNKRGYGTIIVKLTVLEGTESAEPVRRSVRTSN